MSYISLLDNYLLIQTKGNKKNLTRGDFKKIQNDLKKYIKSIKNREDLPTLDKEVERSLLEQVGHLRNSQFPSLKSRYEHLYQTINKKIINVIDFNIDHFKTLKRIRDTVAHGENIKSKYTDLTKPDILKNKLIIFLYYLAFRDLGLSDIDFLKALDNWRNKTRISAHINQTLLHKETGRYTFIEIKKSEFKKISGKLRSTLVIQYSDKTDSYHVLENFLDQINFWFSFENNHQGKTLSEYLTSFLDIKTHHSIGYFNNVYVQHKKDSHPTNGVCILNFPANLRPEHEYWLYNSSEKKWDKVKS